MVLRTIAFGFLLVPLAASAQPLIKSFDSIEATVTNSTYIGVGRILAYKLDNVGNADVQMERVIKGGLTVGPMHLQIPATSEQIAAWKQSHARLVFFDDSTIDLDNPTLLQITWDEKRLTTATDVLDVVMRASLENPGVIQCRTTTKRLIKVHGEDMFLKVPVDKKLERWCLETLRSSADPDRRYTATSALIYFPSTGNVKLLRQLAKDTTYKEYSPGKRTYVIRDAARRVLQRLVGEEIPP